MQRHRGVRAHSGNSKKFMARVLNRVSSEAGEIMWG